VPLSDKHWWDRRLACRLTGDIQEPGQARCLSHHEDLPVGDCFVAPLRAMTTTGNVIASEAKQSPRTKTDDPVFSNRVLSDVAFSCRPQRVRGCSIE